MSISDQSRELITEDRQQQQQSQENVHERAEEQLQQEP
jgi:hypothetical protein